MANPCMGTWGEGTWPQRALCVVGRGAALAGWLGSRQSSAQRGLPSGFARFCSPLVVTQWEQSLKKRSEMTVGANLVHLSQPWGLHTALRGRACHHGLQHCSCCLAFQVQCPCAHSLPLPFPFTLQAGWPPPEIRWLEALRMGRQSGQTVVSEDGPHFYHLFP